jgi:thiamine pyrophosphate-dependent acetolactate synthase large subunit-like protein
VALAEAQDEAVALAEALGAPMFECYASEFNAPATHPLNIGSVNFVTPKPLTARLAECDALLVVGAPAFQLIFPEPLANPLPRSAKLIQIDAGTHEIGKNLPPTVGILADPKAALADLVEMVAREQTPAKAEAARARAAEIEQRSREARRRYWAQAEERWNDVPIIGPRLMHEVRHALPEDGMVFAEAITNSFHLEQAMRPDRPGRLVKGRGGGIGPGLPGTLGAALACPDRKVVGVCSDGAAMYSITALWTAAHHRIPVTYVMLNNASYRILKLNMVEYLGSAAQGRQFVAMDLTDPDLRFDRMAEALGVPGRRVERPEELGEALKAAIAHGGPSLVDVAIESPVP